MKANKADRLPRGSNPPFIPIGDAFQMANEIYESAGGKCGLDLLSQILGNSPSSSSFHKKLGALRQFDLLGELDGNQVELTPLGYAIAAPASPEDAAASKKRAFLKIDAYARVYERHKGKLLPADEFLKNIFEQEIGLPKELANDWVSSFKKSAHATGLLYKRGDGKTQILDTPFPSFAIPSEVRAIPPENGGAVIAEPIPASVAKPNPTASQASESGHTTRIQLSGNRLAVFSIPDSLSVRDGQKLKSALTGLTSIIDSLISEEPG